MEKQTLGAGKVRAEGRRCDEMCQCCEDDQRMESKEKQGKAS